jgi:kynurenine formamidase
MSTRRRSWVTLGFVLMMAGHAMWVAGCSRQESGPVDRPAAAAAEQSPLDAMVQALASGKVQTIDLSQPLTPDTPVIQLPPPFANTPGFKKHVISNYDAKGPGWYWNWIEIGEHVGTHFDAPCHWVTGKGQACVDDLAARDFVGPAVVIDVTADAQKNADFVATRQTLLDWENRHGRIPARAWVILRTGWGSRASDAKTFFNIGADGSPHYPGFGKESAEFLTKERDILGVGTEAIGTDAAIGATAEPAFPNHSIMHGAGKFGLTQLANVDRLPVTGALIIAAPLKLQDGSGSPVRVVALAPAR